METIGIVQDGRSEDFDSETFKAFKKKVSEFKTRRAAADFFGISGITLDNLILKGSGRPNTIDSIKQKLQVA